MANSGKLSIKRLIKIILMTVSGLMVSLMFIPVILPVFLVFYVISRCAVVLIKLLYGFKTAKANGTDVLSGKETQESFPIINVAFRFKGKMDMEKFRERIFDVVVNSYDEKGNRRYKRLTQMYKKAFGYQIWEDAEKFDIYQHIKIIQLEDLLSPDSEMQNDDSYRVNFGPEKKILFEAVQNSNWELLMKIILNKFGAQRVEPGIPQWQLLLLKENESRYTALFRFHHAIADGIYVSRMLCEAFLDSPTVLFHSYVPPSTVYKILRNLWSFCLLPYGLWKIACNKDDNVIHGPRLSGNKNYYVSKRIQIDVLRKIRKMSGVSIHGVLFSCLSYALSSHFKRRSTYVPEITTLIPMPLQNLQKPIQLKNRYAVVSLKLPTPAPAPDSRTEKKCSDKIYKYCSSIERLQAVKVTLEGAKQDPTFLSVHSLITTFCSFLPATLSESLLSTKGCSVAFSNLPGPQDEIYFDKDRIEEVMFWIPDRSPLGVGLSILSYKGHIRAGLAIDDALLNSEVEGDIFIKDFESEIDHQLQELRDRECLQENIKSEQTELLKVVP